MEDHAAGNCGDKPPRLGPGRAPLWGWGCIPAPRPADVAAQKPTIWRGGVGRLQGGCSERGRGWDSEIWILSPCSRCGNRGRAAGGSHAVSLGQSLTSQLL